MRKLRVVYDQEHNILYIDENQSQVPDGLLHFIIKEQEIPEGVIIVWLKDSNFSENTIDIIG